ncbi:MAG: ATP-binding protein [Pseudomonadota bacterium]
MTAIGYEQIWQAMPNPGIILSGDDIVADLNGAAEHFLAMSRRSLVGRSLLTRAGEDSRIADVIQRVRAGAQALSEYNVEFAWPEAPVRMADIFATPLDEGAILILIHPRANAEAMNRQMTSRDAARSVVGMASMLAHEIKNPLAGISGAAQLLEMSLSDEDSELTELIRDEADRIGNLVKRVEEFGDFGLARRRPVNIHDVLDRAAKSAKAGFADHVRFVEDYDPSLPPTMSDPDQLIQVFMNLLKNAAEATPEVGGVIMLKTAYRAGVKVRTPRGQTESLPLQISISDNGTGVPEDLRSHIFEPFVTSKAKGSGLGLALVSKIVADHGGVISCDSAPGFTMFRMLMPVASASDIAQFGDDQEDAA